MQNLSDLQPYFWFMMASIIFVLYLLYLERRQVAASDRIEVEIVDHQEIHDHSATFYAARYRYEYQGQVYHNTSNSRTPVKVYNVGQFLPAYVNRERPSEIRLIGRVSESPLKVFRYVMTGVMCLCIFIFGAALTSYIVF